MTGKLFLGSIIIIVGAYTAPVVADQGLLTLLPSFFAEMSKMNWQGQFNVDFFMFLLMSGFWIAWRNRFSLRGISLGVGGVFLGAPYLSAYLLYLGQRHGWDFNKVFSQDM
jgi:hypothetical protein